MDPKDKLIAATLSWANFEQAMFEAEGDALMQAMADSVNADGDLRNAVDEYLATLEKGNES